MKPAIPGRSTFDGVVVPAGAGASPTTLFIVLGGVAAITGVIGMLVAGLMLVFGVWVLPAVMVAASTGAGFLVLVMVWALQQPDGLRVGATDVALLQGSRVVWRRPLVEIDRVDWQEGRDRLTLVAVDGEMRGVGLGSLWDQPGAVVLLVHHLRAEVEKARAERIGPDEQIVALVRGAGEGGVG